MKSVTELDRISNPDGDGDEECGGENEGVGRQDYSITLQSPPGHRTT